MKLIFVHGLAAVGKLTVAKALAERTGFALFHNHLVLDALLAVFPFGSPPFVRLRHLYWLAMFEEAARENRSLVFTFAPEASVPESFFDEARDAVRRHGGAIHFIGLTCDPDEIERRVENSDRKKYKKLASLDTLRSIRASGRSLGRMPPSDLALDTTDTPPEEIAAAICAHFALAPEGSASPV